MQKRKVRAEKTRTNSVFFTGEILISYWDFAPQPLQSLFCHASLIKEKNH